MDAFPTLSERRQISEAPGRRSSSPENVEPTVDIADASNDYLFRWLSPFNSDYGMSVAQDRLYTAFPDEVLGLPAHYNWKLITFDRSSPNLTVFDMIPDDGFHPLGDSSNEYFDTVNSGIPRYADIRQVQVSKRNTQSNGWETTWAVRSDGDLPGIPDAYRLGYNLRAETNDHTIVYYYGATSFSASNWRWSVRDVGKTLFPGWDNNLDVSRMVVNEAPASGEVIMQAEVRGVLRNDYSDTDVWPRFYWYLDSDDNRTTGDDFSLGYQSGSEVFRYDLIGIDAVVEVFYDGDSQQWLGLVRKKIGINDWQTVTTSAPIIEANRITMSFPRADAGIMNRFRWGLLSWFEIRRGTLSYFGQVDVAPNAGMQVQTLTVSPEQALVERFSPLIYTANEEGYFPVAVDYTVDTSSLALPGGASMAATFGLISAHATDGSRLDLPGSRPSETRRAWDSGAGRIPTVYARIVRSGLATAIQYWLHYYYSDWGYTKGCDNPGVCFWELANNHEGDWEMIQVVLQDGQPAYAVYAQHNTAARRAWQYVERQGDRPIVYVGLGSHASFFKDAHYFQLGLSSESTGNEFAGAMAVQLLPDNNDSNWIAFRGRWGMDESPHGPRWQDLTNERSNWEDPWGWASQASWDESLNYGGCKSIYPDPAPNRNWRACISGNSARFLEMTLRDASGNVLISADTNAIDPLGKKAEYMLNCLNGGEQNIILYKHGINYAFKALAIEFQADPCEGSRDSMAPLNHSDAISITLNIPHSEGNEIRIVAFTNITVSVNSRGTINLDSSAPELLLDYNTDSVPDVSVAPTVNVTQTVDFAPPDAVVDLSSRSQGDAAILHWTAPGDNPDGRVLSYEVRYATYPVTADTWQYATVFPHDLLPSEPGIDEQLPIRGIAPGVYYVAVRSSDAGYNYSDLSNAVQMIVPSVVYLPAVTR